MTSTTNNPTNALCLLKGFWTTPFSHLSQQSRQSLRHGVKLRYNPIKPQLLLVVFLLLQKDRKLLLVVFYLFLFSFFVLCILTYFWFSMRQQTLLLQSTLASLPTAHNKCVVGGISFSLSVCFLLEAL